MTENIRMLASDKHGRRGPNIATIAGRRHAESKSPVYISV